MKYSKNCTKQDYVLRITQSSPAELNVINYELFLLAAENALEFAQNGDLASFTAHVGKAREFLAVLQTSLDPRFDLSSQLMPIYVYISKILADCLRTETEGELQDAVKIMTQLHGAWKTVAENADENAQNAPKITAGMMYNRFGELEDIAASNKDYKI